MKEWLWLEKALPHELRQRLDAGMLDGLAWLSEHFTVEDNPDPPENMWHYYYLYGLERTGAKTGVRFVGGSTSGTGRGRSTSSRRRPPRAGGRRRRCPGSPRTPRSRRSPRPASRCLFLKRATRVPLVPVAPPVVTGGGEAPVDNR